MTVKDDLFAKVGEYARSQWAPIPQGRVVPTEGALTHGNTGIHIDATVLYADIDGSTGMVDAMSDMMAAEYYKAYLECSARLIKDNGGTITAYDGDRVMAIFMGDEQVVNAVTAALQINKAVQEIINPIFATVYEAHHRELQHNIGIDTSKILAAKIGVRLDNDIVWVGPAANYAAKLTSFENMDSKYQIRISEQAMQLLGLMHFTRTADGLSVWEGPYSNLSRGKHYSTNCWIPL
jgi:class 3 adenylate cyclase